MAATIAAVRDWVGSAPDDATITAELTRFADHARPADRAALAILRRREADMEAEAQSFGIDGDYREAKAALADRLKIVQGRIARLERLTGDTAGGALPTLTQARICTPGGAR